LKNSNRFTAKSFRPYAEAIGQVALTWNDLHETLGILFTEVAFEGSLAAQDAWQSLIVDRAKREMLKSVLVGMTVPDDRPELAQLRDDVIWIIEQTSAAEDGRNAAIHTPLLSHDHPAIETWAKIPAFRHSAFTATAERKGSMRKTF